MASGGTRVKCGQFTGTGAAINITTVGFKPRKVKLINSDNPATMEWNEAMADAAALQFTAVAAAAFLTAEGITPLANGFTVGGDADSTNNVNVDTETVYWEAHE